MKILIIEDEIKTGEYLLKGLTEAGFACDHVLNGVDGLYKATSDSFDLIVLDVMLPNLNGWQVLTTLRASSIDTPVILLTAKDQVEDRVKGFELGANDYLVKPFAFVELLARIRNALRKTSPTNYQTILNVGDLYLDQIKRRVSRANIEITLTAKEFALLELFMQRRGEVMSRSQIASSVWDINFDCDTNVIDVAVRRLRSKMDNNFDEKLIHTVRGMGYLLDDHYE